MASYTEKLNLLKKNPVTDGADTFNVETMMNENWDKIDGFSAFLEASIAPPYSASSAYAVGAWCTYYGKLYQCTTAIGSGGEAWNANHWAAKNATDLAKDAVKTFVRPNLLDNWYFVGGGSQQQGGGRLPVNQKGLTTYQGEQYCVDRWLLSHSSAQAALRANCIRLTASSSENAFLSQIIENGFNNLKGQTVTWSVLTTSGLATLSGVVPTTAPSSGYTTIISLNSQIPNSNSCSLALDSDGVLFAQIGIRAGYQMDIIATKLEIGDTQTLAHQENGAWVLNEIPNFEVELAKCQRFDFWVKNTSSSTKYAYAMGMTIHNSASFVNAVAYTPVPMRVSPVVSHASCDVYRFTNGNRVTIADSAPFTAFSAVENAVGLSIKADTGMTADETVMIEILPGGFIHFDANR